MLDVLDAWDGAGRAAARVTVAPVRRPKAVTPIALRPLPPESWPALRAPAATLTPPAGRSHDPAAKGPPATAVAVFGLQPDALRTAVAGIADRLRNAPDFAPLFLTDAADHAVFRRHGYIAQYFPPALTAPGLPHENFRDRLTLAWKKWNVRALIDLSAPGWLEPRIAGLALAEPRTTRTSEDQKWERPFAEPVRPPTPDIAALRAEYEFRGLDREPDTFALYRIIGNDLYPRHGRGQSVRSVRFILENEPLLRGVTRRWVINRIVDPDDEKAVLAILDAAGESYLRIPFVMAEYAAIDWDFEGFDRPDYLMAERYRLMSERYRMRAEARVRRLKNNYLVNNNGARNLALRDGRRLAKWVLPWDGNCFLTAEAWDGITRTVTASPYLKYFTVPMARITDNAALTVPGFAPLATEEPQILFRRDAAEEFDERFPYGRRPKVELLVRLGVAGGWDIARDDAWDLPRPQLSPEASAVGTAGWVARLSSGMADLEAASKTGQTGREVARNEAVIGTLDALDAAVLRQNCDPKRLVAYDEDAIAALGLASPGSAAAGWLDALRAAAEAALASGPYSVLDKTSVAPSGDRQDYWHPAPYWWPNPATADGLPYVRRDGERVPGTILYEPGSEAYDRTRLQRMFDETTILSLAFRATGDVRYGVHAARLVRTWFVDPGTRMNPHLAFAQVHPGHSEITGFGVIEMKDLYFLLDAVRILERAGAMDAAATAAFRAWLEEYLVWLRTSPQGTAERPGRNNHGTCYDLQLGAIAAWLGDVPVLLEMLRRVRSRLLDQFAADGSQPEELKRTQSQHYAAFNLQSWLNLARLAESCGVDLFAFEGKDGRSLRRGLDWLLPLLSAPSWPWPQAEAFDRDRRLPLTYAYLARFGRLPAGVTPASIPPPSALKPLFFPHDGIQPFWMLGLPIPEAHATARRLAG
ncbi:MAG: alginate lyase family protein [Bauldia sp.]|nr:alginate lyase family protein [Bauldia sp.]